MSRAIVLACGNALRGDDGLAPQIAGCLLKDLHDPEIQIRSDQQWTPELAEPISKAELVIFLDASASILTGEVACRRLRPAGNSATSITHQTSPSALLFLAQELYGSRPAHAYLITVGGASFELKEGLSEPVRRAIPDAIELIKSVLSGIIPPER